MNNLPYKSSSLPKYASKLVGKLTHQVVSPNINMNNVSDDGGRETKKDLEDMKAAFAQYEKYIKLIIDEKKHYQKDNKGNVNYFSQTSRMSSQTKSQIMKAEDKNMKITFQQFVNYEEKNKLNRPEGPHLILSDNDTENESTENRIKALIKLLETFDDSVLERSYCKNLHEVILLELYVCFSQLGFKLNDKNNEHRTQIKNYLNNLIGNVKYDIFSSPNYTLTHINQGFIDIPEIFNKNTKKPNLTSYYYPSDSSSSESESDEPQKNKDIEDSDVCEEVVAEEVNAEYVHKLVFYDEKKKNVVNSTKQTNELNIYPDNEYLQRKNHLLSLREHAYDNIIEIINTDSKLLPKYKHKLEFDQIMSAIKEVKEKIKKEHEDEKNKNNDDYILFEDEDEEDYEDDNEYSPIMITQNNAPSNTILRSLNKSLDNISIVKYKKSNFYTSRNLITIKVKKNNSFEKIKEEFNDITKIYPYLSVRQKTDLSLKKLQLSRQKRNDDYFNSFVENDNDDDFIK